MDTLYEIFWSDSFWLPSKLTWTDIHTMPSTWDLWICLPVSILLYLIRCLWERYIATPIGRYYFHLKEKCTSFDQNETINKILKKCNSQSHDEIADLCVKETNFTLRQVQRYIRKYKNAKKSSPLTKFTETSWKFIFYFSIFVYGLWSLWDKEWLLDPKMCWVGWPVEHSLPKEIYWYYMLESGFYISTSVSLCFDVKRKDFVEMLIHHIATIVLLFFSYMDNMCRFGSLVLIIHDFCDIFMEAAKMAKYANFQRLCDSFFAFFAFSWFITRLIIYPFSILKLALFEAPSIVSVFGDKPYIYYLLNTMMCTLQVLHIIWFCFIVNIIYLALVKGHVQKDSRSDTEFSQSSEADNGSLKSNGVQNGLKHN